MKLNHKTFGDSNNQVLIILHGLLGSLNNWQTLAKHFVDAGLYVITVDQRNHGKSPHSDEWSYELMAQDLKNIIDSQQLASPIILGHSMGGKTVMRFAQDYPTIAKKIIVADISPRQYGLHHQSILKGLNEIDVKNIKSRKEADEVLSKYVNGVGERQFLLQNLERATKGFNWKMNLDIITKNISIIGEAQIPDSTISTPILFIRGGNSGYIATEDEMIISQYFNQSAIKTIPDAGHWLHAEQPKVFFDMVINFIKD